MKGKIPNPMEDLMEMHEKLFMLEEKGNEVVVLFEIMIIRLQAFQNLLKTIEASFPEGPIEKNDTIDNLNKHIARYNRRKTQWEELMKQKKYIYEQLEVYKTLELKSKVEQMSSIQIEDISIALALFKHLTESHTIELKMQEQIMNNDEKDMDMIDKMLSDFNSK